MAASLALGVVVSNLWMICLQQLLVTQCLGYMHIRKELATHERGAGDLIDYCQWETLNATCQEAGHVIVMRAAMYGRMRFGRCVKEDHGNRGCSADVLPQLDGRCSGRASCLVSVPDQELHNAHPCPKELMPYLQASYSCVNVHNTDADKCGTSGAVTVDAEHGFLALPSPSAPYNAPLGTALCPWLLTVARGRRINVTLYNFAGPSAGSSFQHQQQQHYHSHHNLPPVSSSLVTSRKCHGDVVMEETDGRRLDTPLCDSRQRLSPIFLSATSALKIYFRLTSSVSRDNSDSPFPFIVEFKAVGCADMEPVANAVTVREGDSTTVRCNNTGHTFFLLCTGGTWLGELGNCSQDYGANNNKKVKANNKYDYAVKAPKHKNYKLCVAIASSSSSSKIEVTMETRAERLPYGLFLVIGVGVALGVTIGIILLFATLLLFRRQRYRSGTAAAGGGGNSRRRVMRGSLTVRSSSSPSYSTTYQLPPPPLSHSPSHYAYHQQQHLHTPQHVTIKQQPQQQHLYDKTAPPCQWFGDVNTPLYTTCDCPQQQQYQQFQQQHRRQSVTRTNLDLVRPLPPDIFGDYTAPLPNGHLPPSQSPARRGLWLDDGSNDRANNGIEQSGYVIDSNTSLPVRATTASCPAPASAAMTSARGTFNCSNTLTTSYTSHEQLPNNMTSSALNFTNAVNVTPVKTFEPRSASTLPLHQSPVTPSQALAAGSRKGSVSAVNSQCVTSRPGTSLADYKFTHSDT